MALSVWVSICTGKESFTLRIRCRFIVHVVQTPAQIVDIKKAYILD